MKRSNRNVATPQGVANVLSLVVLCVCLSLLALSLASCTATSEALVGGASTEKTPLSVSGDKKEPETSVAQTQDASQLYQEKRYQEVVLLIEAELKDLPDVPENAERREKFLSMLRLAKAKLLLARYQGQLNEIKEKALRSKEIAGLVITQTYGTIWRSEYQERRKASTGGSVYLGSTFFVREKSGLEITSEDGEMIRAVDSSVFSFFGNRGIRLNEGTFLLHLPKGAESFRVEAPLAEATFWSKKASTALISVTTSGGLKIIANERDLTVTLSKGGETKLRPGELVFALPEPQGLSRKMDVELSTIIMTANLLTGFEEPVPFNSSLRLAAAIQAQRIKGRFRAVVGDVKTDDDFQVKVVPEDEEAEPDKKGGLSKFFQGILGRDQNE